MDHHELEALLGDLESHRVERKESAASTEKIQQAICAFANDLSNSGREGVVFVGLKDDGSCAGLPITDQLLTSLAAIRSDGNILPLPAISVEKITFRGCDVAAIIVKPALAPPVRYKGATYVRIGPRRAIATAQEEKILSEKRRYKDPSYDLWGVPGASIGDLNLEFFRGTFLPSAIASEVLAENERTLEDQLRSLRFLRIEESDPTVLGLLVSGKFPRRFLPGAYVQFLRLAGNDLASPIQSEKLIEGNILDVVRQLDELLRLHIEVAVSITEGPVEVRKADYPIAAIQQLVRNALMYRSYQDTNAPIRVNWFNGRIEILSPGGPYGQVTIHNFGRPGVADYRNPHLSAAMKSLGLVQQFGVGISTAQREMSKNGNPKPEFNVNNSYVLATLRRSS